MREGLHGRHLFVEEALVARLAFCPLNEQLGHDELVLAVKASNHDDEDTERFERSEETSQV